MSYIKLIILIFSKWPETKLTELKSPEDLNPTVPT